MDKVRSLHKDWSLSLCLAAAWCSVNRDSEWRYFKPPSNLLCKPRLTPFSLLYLFTESKSKVSTAVKTICFNSEMTNIRLSLLCFTWPTLVTLSGVVLCSSRTLPGILFFLLCSFLFFFLNECSSYLSFAVENVGLILHWYKVARKSDHFMVAPA